MQENESFDFLKASDADFLIFAMEEDDGREEDNLINFSDHLFKTYVEDRSDLSSLFPDEDFSDEDLVGIDLYCIVDGCYMNIDTFDTRKDAEEAEALFRLRLEKKLKNNIKDAFRKDY